MHKQVAHIINNLDDLTEKATRMKLTKNDFLNVLREVTRSKILSIREARTIFDNRVRKLIKAQRYEVRSQELYGVAAAQKVFTH